MARSVGLIAHDAQKEALVGWALRHRSVLAACRLVATGTTGRLVQDACPELAIERLKSGPLGGDQQIGARIAEGALDALIFFIDPLSALPHDVDVKALLRLAVLYDVAVAMNAATADCLIAAWQAGETA